MGGSSGWETADWLRLVPAADGVELTALSRWLVRDERFRLAGSSFFGVSLTDKDLDDPRAIELARWGGLTGSKAGLSGSSMIGLGVDGVE